jgi:hypothetical protein
MLVRHDPAPTSTRHAKQLRDPAPCTALHCKRLRKRPWKRLAPAELALALVPGNPTDLYACEIPLVNASPSRPGSNIHTPRKAAPRPRSMHRCHTRLADLATPQPYPCGPRGSHPSPPLGRHPYLPLRRSRFPDYRPVDACARRSPEPSSEITLIPLAS